MPSRAKRRALGEEPDADPRGFLLKRHEAFRQSRYSSSPSPCILSSSTGGNDQFAADMPSVTTRQNLNAGGQHAEKRDFQRESMLVRMCLLDIRWTPAAMFLLSGWFCWRSLGDSNPCFRRERATSWAARRREQARKVANSADQRRAQGEAHPSGTDRDSLPATRRHPSRAKQSQIMPAAIAANPSGTGSPSRPEPIVAIAAR
jgi:hypothetical protein